MKNYSPIEKLEMDIQDYTSLLIQAKLELNSATSQGAELRAIRIRNRIEYFTNRIAVSKSELARFRALHDMGLSELTKARLIAANKFYLSSHTECSRSVPVEVSEEVSQ